MESQLGLIIGASNKVAIDALRNPAIQCLWLFGPSDVGKSYLANLFSPGALILDTVDPATDLAATLDQEWNANHRVVMISPGRPREVLSNPRHLTRVTRGVVCPLEPWTDEMRERYFTDLTPGADNTARLTLLECVSGGPRTLYGLAAAWRVSGFGASPEEMAPLAAAYGSAGSMRFHGRIHAEDVIELVCEHFNMKISDMLSQRRTKNMAGPRHIAQYLVKECTQATLTEVGKFFGGRDHSTVLHAVNKIKKRMSEDLKFCNEVTRLRKMLETEKG